MAVINGGVIVVCCASSKEGLDLHYSVTVCRPPLLLIT